MVAPALPDDAESPIVTARLRLEALLPEHADELFSVLADRALYEFTGGGPPATVEDLRARYELLSKRRSPDGSELWLNWMVREVTGGDAVGYVQASVDQLRADLAWVVSTRWQSKGYASEASAAMVRWLQHRLGTRAFIARVRDGHIASEKVASRLHMVATGEVADGERVWRRSTGSAG